TVFRRASSFRHQSAFTTWLYRLTTNACHDIGRRKSRTPVPMETLPTQLAGTEREADTRLIVEQALRGLPEDQRVPIVMRDLYGMSYDEIAAATGAPSGTVKSRIARGRMRLIELLGMSEDTEPGGGPGRLTGQE
ncbi:MAG TPA: sigma-70 family RNA polymerase sigma factor, partial [Gemmatimonadales bacterium]|nr:sigma-70 family RNA polymerase sigma factor [Gemmatimonadales bacterium]